MSVTIGGEGGRRGSGEHLFWTSGDQPPSHWDDERPPETFWILPGVPLPGLISTKRFHVVVSSWQRVVVVALGRAEPLTRKSLH